MSSAADAIYARLTPVFRDVFDDDTLVPSVTMTAADVDGWDSLSHIRLVVAIEAAFQVRFTMNELVNLKNVGELVALLRRKGVT